MPDRTPAVRRAPLAATVLALAMPWALPARAADAAAHYPVTTVVMREEQTLTLTDALVRVAIVAGVKPDEAADARTRMVQTVKQASPADWALVRFDALPQPSGLLNLTGVVQARLPLLQADQLAAALLRTDTPGFRARVQQVSVEPPLKTVEQAYNDMRARIYARAKAECQRLAEATGRICRVGGIEQRGAPPGPVPLASAPAPAPMMATRTAESAEAAPQIGDFERRYTLDAQVTLVLTD